MYVHASCTLASNYFNRLFIFCTLLSWLNVNHYSLMVNHDSLEYEAVISLTVIKSRTFILINLHFYEQQMLKEMKPEQRFEISVTMNILYWFYMYFYCLKFSTNAFFQLQLIFKDKLKFLWVQPKKKNPEKFARRDKCYNEYWTLYVLCIFIYASFAAKF